MRLVEFFGIINEDPMDETGPSVIINYNGQPKKALKPARARNDVLITVPTAAFDDAFKRSGESWYTGPGGGGATIGDRYPNFQEWIETNDIYAVPEVYVDDRGIVSFTNGRHRYSVLRDAGVDPMPVAMDREGLHNAKKFGLVSNINESAKGWVNEMPNDDEEKTPAMYKELMQYVKNNDLDTLIQKLNMMGKFDSSIFLSYVRKFISPQKMMEIIDYWKASFQMNEAESKCGVYNALARYRPDLRAEMGKVPSGKVNPSILFLQDHGLWNDQAHRMAREMNSAMQAMKSAKTEIDYAKSDGEKEELKTWYNANEEAYLKKRDELMAYVVRLIKNSQDPNQRLQSYRTDRPE